MMTNQDQIENTEDIGVTRRGFLGLMGAGVAATTALVSVDSDAKIGHKAGHKLAYQQNEASYTSIFRIFYLILISHHFLAR